MKIEQQFHAQMTPSELEREVSRLESIFGHQLIDELTINSKSNNSQGRKVYRRSGVLRFLAWLSHRPTGSLEHRVFRAFIEGPGPVYLDADGSTNHRAFERAFYDCFSAWCREFIAANQGLQDNTIVAFCRDAAWALQQCAGQQKGIPESFKALSIRLHQPGHRPTESLGEARWDELTGKHGLAREREALRITRAEFCRIFEEEETAFRRGRTILDGGVPDEVAPDVCARIRPALIKLNQIFYATGCLSLRFLMTQDLLNREEFDLGLWRKAGLAKENRNSVLNGPCLIPFIPSRRMVAGAVGVFICDTGWNLQPTLDLPAQPFLFQSTDKAYIGTSLFIESFKNRAGHHVLAHLDGDSPSDGRWLDDGLRLWRESVDAEGKPLDPQHAVIDTIREDGQPSVLDILHRFRTVREVSLDAVAGHHGHNPLRECFWIHSGERGLIKADSLNMAFAKLGRKGINSRAIRKSVMAVRHDEAGSVRGAALAAGHRGTGVIMPHYLNSSYINAQLDQNIRAFQNAIQGLMTRSMDPSKVATMLGITVGDLEAMRIHAWKAGIIAALGLLEYQEDGGNSFVVKFPASDPARLSELYLTHKALRQLGHRMASQKRWRIRYLPMLAMAKAIGREVFRSGHGAAYRKCARAANAALTAGIASLPFFGE